MIEISQDVVYVKGAKNGAIYKFGTGEVFSVNNIACSIIDKIIENDSLNSEELEYESLLVKNGLIDKPLKMGKYSPEFFGNQLNLAWLEITQKCNMKCLHCYEGDNHASENNPLSVNEWKKVIDQLKNLNVKRIVVIGGEPTLQKDIVEIMKYLSELRTDVTIFTNGSQITDELRKIIVEKGIRVKVSLYGHNSFVHDRITCIPGSFITLIDNIKYFLKCGVKVSIAVVLMRENEEHYDSILNFVKSLNVESYKFDVIREVFDGKQSLHTPKQKDIVNYARRLAPQFKISKGKFDKACYKNTCWDGKIVVSECGKVMPCVFARDIICGNLREKSLKDILEGEQLRKCWEMTFQEITQCKDCEFRFACNDCRPLAMSKDNCLTAKNPRCGYNVYTGEWK